MYCFKDSQFSCNAFTGNTSINETTRKLRREQHAIHILYMYRIHVTDVSTDTGIIQYP